MNQKGGGVKEGDSKQIDTLFDKAESDIDLLIDAKLSNVGNPVRNEVIETTTTSDISSAKKKK